MEDKGWKEAGEFYGEYSPNISRILDFGDSSKAYDQTFPSSEHPLLLSRSSLRLSTIKYKTFQSRGYKYLSGIQLSFTNDEEGPMIQTSSAETQQQTTLIPITQDT